MKKTPLLLLLIFSLFACQNGEQKAEQSNDEPAASPEVESPVKPAENTKMSSIDDIKTLYAEIISLKKEGKLSTSSFDYDCHGEKFGTVTFFSDDQGVKLIEQSGGEYSHYELAYQYFVKDGQPFFIFHKGTYWTFDTEASKEGATRDNITEERFYIVDGELVLCLKKEFTIRSSVKDNPEPDEIANEEVSCPPIRDLMSDFKILMKYQDSKEAVKCLE